MTYLTCSLRDSYQHGVRSVTALRRQNGANALAQYNISAVYFVAGTQAITWPTQAEGVPAVDAHASESPQVSPDFAPPAAHWLLHFNAVRSSSELRYQ